MADQTPRKVSAAAEWQKPIGAAVRELLPTAACPHDAAVLFASISKQLGKDEAIRIFNTVSARTGRQQNPREQRVDSLYLAIYDLCGSKAETARQVAEMPGMVKLKKGSKEENWDPEASAKKHLQRLLKRERPQDKEEGITVESAVDMLFKGLVAVVGDETKARRILLESAPDEHNRHLFEAALPSPSRVQRKKSVADPRRRNK
jgi:hypothetical protein